MFCPKCGKETEAVDAFCRACGHNLKTDIPATEAATVAVPMNPPKDPFQKLLIYIGTAFGIFFFLFIVIAVWVGVTSNLETEQQNKIRAYQQKKETEFQAMTPEQHIENASGLLKQVASNQTISQVANNQTISTALHHLDALPDEDKRSNKAKVLYRKAESEKKRLIREAAERARAAEIEKNPLRVVRDEWKKGGFGSVALWKVTLKNRSKKKVGNILYETEYYGETNLRLRQNTDLIPKVILPGRTRTIEFSDGFIPQGTSRASFEILSTQYVP